MELAPGSNPFYWLVGYGDPKPYTDVGAGELFAVTMLLALGGILCIITRATRDRWWLWVLLGLLLASIPAALTPDRHDTLRLAALPVFYLLLASLGLHWLMTRPRRRVVTVALAVAAAALFAQWAYFVDEYSSHRPSRTALFDADVPRLLQRAFSGGATVYMDHDDRYAETQARWYALTHHIDRARVSVLPDGGFAPPGAMVFGRTQACDYACNPPRGGRHILDRARGRHGHAVMSFGPRRPDEPISWALDGAARTRAARGSRGPVQGSRA